MEIDLRIEFDDGDLMIVALAAVGIVVERVLVINEPVVLVGRLVTDLEIL